MRIGIDARPLTCPLAGIGYYLTNMLKRMQEMDKENEYFLYSDKDFYMPFSNDKWKKRIGSRPIEFAPTFWFFMYVSRWTKKDKIDVFWSPWPILPFGLKAKKAVTVYDFTWRICPETMNVPLRILLQILGESSISRADAVFTISQATFDDMKKFNIRAKNAHAIQLGADAVFVPMEKKAAALRISVKYGCSEKYILNVGTIEPRKNVITLFRAFKSLKEKYKFPYQLLIAGGKGWKTGGIYEEFIKLGIENDVKFLGYVPEEDMPALYSGARLFVYPSLYEGFGLPLLEAMSCGCPVITSDRSSLPEVVGDSGILVDPLDVDKLAEEINSLAGDQQRIDALIKKGLERAKLFSWERAAKRTWGILTSLRGAEK